MPEVEVKSITDYDPETLQDLLPIYYKRIFPHKAFYRWLSYGFCEYYLLILLADFI
jgi:DNA primase small subunit